MALIKSCGFWLIGRCPLTSPVATKSNPSFSIISFAVFSIKIWQSKHGFIALPYPYFGFKNISIYLSFNETNLIGIFKKSAIFLAGSLLYISISSSFITEYSKPVINLIARTSIFSLLSIAPASELSNPPDKSKIAFAFLFIINYFL